MQKKFIQAAGLIITIAMVITILITFLLQTFLSYSNAQKELDDLFNDVQTRIAENDASIAQLKQSTGEDFIARTRAFSYMIAQNPEIITSIDELNRIIKLLDVDEVHVTDEKGVIRWGTVPDYYGFDMRDSEQTAEFVPLLSNKSLELAQEPQPNGTKGILYQYIGVSRSDKTGIVQIGLQPTRLERALENNQIGNVLERYNNDSTSIFALSKADDTVLWHTNSSNIGKTAQEIGLSGGSVSFMGTYKNASVAGQSAHVSAREIGDYIIVAQMNRSVMMSGRNMQLIFLLISDILVVLVMVAAINWLLKKQIVSPIHKIADVLKTIEDGDLDTVVDVHTCPEFTILSDGINAMVGSIRIKMQETAQLLDQQQQVSAQIQQAAVKLNAFSQDNLTTANRIAEGSTEQAASMEELTANISTLAHQMESNSKKAGEASQVSTDAGEALRQAMQVLQNLVESMHQVNEMSNEIRNVVKAIDEISFQTNILALNAAVEAARAGAAGKGFSVVADEVRMLAGKSAESARQTAQMIGRSTEVMRTGEEAAKQAALTVESVLEKAGFANQLTDAIAHAAGEQAETIIQIRAAGEQINNVIQNNSELAEEGRSGVTSLLTQIQGLRALSSNSLLSD